MILIALPAYNEAKYIGSIIHDVLAYADEILVVDDGSTDGTDVVACQSGARVMRHVKNRGYGATIQTILKEARLIKLDVLVIMDADTQHYPEDIPQLVAPVLDGYDLAIGSRNHDSISSFRNLGGNVLSFFTRILSGENIRDSQCGFRAYSPNAVAKIKPQENGMAVSSEIISLATQQQLDIIEVPVSIKYTKDSSTYNPIAQGFYTLFKVIGMIIKRRFLSEHSPDKPKT